MSAQPNVKAIAAAAIVPAEFEPIIRNLSESLYDKLLGDAKGAYGFRRRMMKEGWA